MAERKRALGRAVPVAAATSALDAPSPSDGQVLRTALPDTFDGIRFEIGRMVKYVQDARKDPLVIDAARMIASTYGDFVSEMGRREGRQIDVHNNKTLYVEGIDLWCRDHFCYVNDPPNVEVIQTPKRMIKQTKVGREVLEGFLAPYYRAMEQADPSFDRRGYQAPPRFIGDCIPVSQKVILRDRSSGSYSVKPIGDIKGSFRNYHVVSVNEVGGRTEFKPIQNYVDKGSLPTFKVSLANGTSFRCTEDHKLYVFYRRSFNGGVSVQELRVMTLRDLAAARATSQSDRYTLAVAGKIPEAGLKSRHVPKLSGEQLWVEGLYVAEGWSEASGHGRRKTAVPTCRSKIGMNDASVMSDLKEKLGVLGQSYGTHVRPDGLETVRISPSEFTHRLRARFGRNSAEKRFPKWYISLGGKQLSTLLHSYALGDAFIPTKGQWKGVADVIYNTKSERLAEQIRFMHMVLGKPVGFYRQPSWKNKPVMYRLYQYSGATQRKLGDLTSSKIRTIEPCGVEECCDITVSDNHNFLLDGGQLVHNCDEAAVMFCSLCVALEIAPVRFRFGGNGGTLHHVWSRVMADGNWYDSDLTEPGYRLGDFSKFEAYEEVEVPL